MSARMLSAITVMAAAVATAGLVVAPSALSATTVTYYAAPSGSGSTCSTSAPCSIAGAQSRARTDAANGNSVIVRLAGGRYALTAPWRLDSRDSAQNGATVAYTAASGATPVITGARAVSGWRASSLGNNIYEATTPTGLDTRQLYVNGQLAPRAQLAVPNSSLALDATGITVKDSSLASLLAGVSTPSRLELESVNSFTDRFSPVASISGNRLTMAQPAWNNNTYGYDTIQGAFRTPQFSIANAPQLLSAAGQWYIDPAAGKLYYRAAAGVDPAGLDVQLPTLQSLLQVSGTLAAPVTGVSFSGLTFTGTSWLRPSSTEGFASQQTGAYLAGADANRPSNAFSACAVGCPGFEATRTKWGTIAGAVQVSAAQRITFSGNRFTNLGSQGLGIGNDGGANASGVDLGAQQISVTGNTFDQLAGGGIIVGGTRPNAHHPTDTRMTNRGITIASNSIHDVGIDYKDIAGIFVTYVDGLVVDRNETYNLPYTAIAVGYGWGMVDAGGSQTYVDRGGYNYYPRYAANQPTTARNYSVTNNVMHHAVTRMNDAACIYTLGAVPTSVITGNYCSDAGNGNVLYSWPIYHDEGSRFFTDTKNVFLRVPSGLHANTQSGASTADLTADNNYISSNVAGCDLPAAPRSTCTNLISVSDSQPLPAAAAAIIDNAGLPRSTVTSASTYTNAAMRFDQRGSTYAITGSGGDTMNNFGIRSDTYGTIFKPAAAGTSSTVTVRVNSYDRAASGSKAGIVLRNDLSRPTQSAGYAAIEVQQEGVTTFLDSNGDGYIDQHTPMSNSPGSGPVYLRLVRRGATVTGSWSSDGSTWTRVGSPMTLTSPNTNLDAGMTWTTANTNRPGTANFDSFTISQT